MNTEERMLVDYTAAGTQELSYTYKNDVKLFNGNSEQLLLSDNTQGIWVYDQLLLFLIIINFLMGMMLMLYLYIMV